MKKLYDILHSAHLGKVVFPVLIGAGLLSGCNNVNAPNSLRPTSGEDGVIIHDNNAIGMQAEISYNGRIIPLNKISDYRDFACFAIPDSIRMDGLPGEYNVRARDRNNNSTTFTIYTLEGHVSEKPFELGMKSVL